MCQPFSTWSVTAASARLPASRVSGAALTRTKFSAGGTLAPAPSCAHAGVTAESARRALVHAAIPRPVLLCLIVFLRGLAAGGVLRAARQTPRDRGGQLAGVVLAHVGCRLAVVQ